MFSSIVHTSLKAHTSQNASRQVIYWHAIFTFSPFITPSFSLGKGHVWDNVYTSACNPWMCKMCELCSLFRTAAAEKGGVLRFGRVGWEVRPNTNKAWLWSWRLWKQGKRERDVKASQSRESDSISKKTNSFQPCVFCSTDVTRLSCKSFIFFQRVFVCVCVCNGWTDTMHDKQGKCLCWQQAVLTEMKDSYCGYKCGLESVISPSSSGTSQFLRLSQILIYSGWRTQPLTGLQLIGIKCFLLHLTNFAPMILFWNCPLAVILCFIHVLLYFFTL